MHVWNEVFKNIEEPSKDSKPLLHEEMVVSGDIVVKDKCILNFSKKLVVLSWTV